ncbi:MAG: polyprenol monophosphomannose synthase [Chitinivibrionales bacterium]|nr:polyprenol monophosphomannose synthase [Chitinivibrionales bacterium]
MAYTKILIIIPTYNEIENIPLIIPAIRSYVPNAHILVVDDSSPDGTAAHVEQMQKTTADLYLLVRKKKEGLGRAYISGFNWALQRGYELIFEMDADFSHNPSYLPEFIRTAESSDLVIGSRYICGVNVINWPMQRLLMSYFANKYARIVAGIPVRDCTSGFKCFRSNVLAAIDLDRVGSSGYSFQLEMNYYVWKKGFSIKEIPIIFTDRRLGTSKMSSKIFREALVMLWKLRLLSLFSTRK